MEFIDISASHCSWNAAICHLHVIAVCVIDVHY